MVDVADDKKVAKVEKVEPRVYRFSLAPSGPFDSTIRS